MPHPQRLGRYEITGVLGEGAMGVVYKGHDPGIQRAVAIKTIHHALAADNGAPDSFAARFRTEARAVGRLSHPGIVAIYDFGEDAGTTYIAMEYVEGRNLSQVLAETPLLPEPVLLSIMAQLLDALASAHRHGVWHRDVKPANLLWTPHGRIKVTDFGIARIDKAGLTRVTSTIGTPGYMAPEQYTGAEIDQRVDVYAAGVLLYRLLAGQAPFNGSAEAVMYQVLHGQPLPPSQVAGSARLPGYDAVVAQAMARDMAQRFASADEFRAALARAAGAALSGKDADATIVRPPPAPAQAAATPGVSNAPMTEVSAVGAWDPATLARLERVLAARIGPLARVLVRQAARAHADLPALGAALAEHIADATDRARFVADLATTLGGSAVGTVKTIAAAVPAPATAPTGAGAGTTITPELLEHAQRVLTQHMGPIAKIVVRKAAAQASSTEGLFQLLTEQVAEGAERTRLLQALQRWR